MLMGTKIAKNTVCLDETNRGKKQYTQDEAIAYECAREIITNLGAILTRKIYDEKAKSQPDVARMSGLYDERRKILEERGNLRIKDHAEVARIQSEYGARVRILI